MVLGADDVQAPRFNDFSVFLLPVGAVGIAATQDNIGTTTGHIGGYSNPAKPSGLSYDCCLVLMVLGVEHLMNHAQLFKARA